jgi:hypothetical protein
MHEALGSVSQKKKEGRKAKEKGKRNEKVVKNIDEYLANPSSSLSSS